MSNSATQLLQLLLLLLLLPIKLSSSDSSEYEFVERVKLIEYDPNAKFISLNNLQSNVISCHRKCAEYNYFPYFYVYVDGRCQCATIIEREYYVDRSGDFPGLYQLGSYRIDEASKTKYWTTFRFCNFTEILMNSKFRFVSEKHQQSRAVIILDNDYAINSVAIQIHRENQIESVNGTEIWVSNHTITLSYLSCNNSKFIQQFNQIQSYPSMRFHFCGKVFVNVAVEYQWLSVKCNRYARTILLKRESLPTRSDIMNVKLISNDEEAAKFQNPHKFQLLHADNNSLTIGLQHVEHMKGFTVRRLQWQEIKPEAVQSNKRNLTHELKIKEYYSISNIFQKLQTSEIPFIAIEGHIQFDEFTYRDSQFVIYYYKQEILQALQRSEATAKISLAAIQTSTAAIQTSTAAIQTSTAAIQTSTAAIQTSTAAIQTSTAAIQTSTAPIQTQNYRKSLQDSITKTSTTTATSHQEAASSSTATLKTPSVIAAASKQEEDKISKLITIPIVIFAICCSIALAIAFLLRLRAANRFKKIFGVAEEQD